MESKQGVIAVERATIVIISDDGAFSGAVTSRWTNAKNVPTFKFVSSECASDDGAGEFDLAVIGRVDAQALGTLLSRLEPAHRPVILVSALNGHTPRYRGVCVVPEGPDWAEMVFILAQEIFERQRVLADLEKLQDTNSELQHQACLGHFMLEARHNLNNALTSILGNSDLILLDSAELSPRLRAQVETIRNMAMRMNEIMQRFSSLQKEMQLVEQQSSRSASKLSIGSGA